MKRTALILSLLAVTIGVSLAVRSVPEQAEEADSNIASAEAVSASSENTATTAPEQANGDETTSTTTETSPPTTTTTVPRGTGSSTSSPDTTEPAQSLNICDSAILKQILADATDRNGNAKNKFDIILTLNKTDSEPGIPLWVAPYKTDLGNGYGWISGDRKGYAGAYMFLVHLESGKVLARVLFHRVESDTESAYFKVNDSKMDEIQTTSLGYDGTCADGSTKDPLTQAQTPLPQQKYVVDNEPEVRPLVPIFVDGREVEDRSYTNTESPDTEFFRFSDGGLTTKPFTDFNGVGGASHTVYQRQKVIARVNIDGGFFTVGVVYYDILDPSASFTK
jgi:hypothetical protein